MPLMTIIVIIIIVGLGGLVYIGVKDDQKNDK